MEADQQRGQTVYKVLARDLWEKAEREGRFAGSGIDLTDGFIHFSTAEQVRETVARHFAGKEDLVLVAVTGEALMAKAGSAYRYEPSRGGAMFPHLYAEMPMDAVAWVRPLPLGADGTHVFPPL